MSLIQLPPHPPVKVQLQLHTLGPLSVQTSGEALPVLRHYRSDLLLLYLALERVRSHTREHLIGLFWPNAREEAGRANLRQALHRIRRALETAQLAQLLVSELQTVRLLPDPALAVDVQQLLALHETCQTHPHRRRSTCHACVSRLQSLTLRYEGPFLASLGGLPESLEAWRSHWQAQLQQRVLQAHTDLIAHFQGLAASDQSQLPQALHHARCLLDLEPFHEETHRQLMHLLARSGQRSAACRHYEAFCERLETELDAEPEDETEELYQQLLHGELPEGPAQTVTDHPLLPLRNRSAGMNVPGHLPAPTNLFFGRQSELIQLTDWLEQPVIRLLTLTGPGGVGKTRLALEALQQKAPSLQHGHYFVSLTGLTAPGELFERIALALQLETTWHSGAEGAVRAFLKPRELLLLLDGFESLTGGAPLLTSLLQEAPGLTLLVTSRTRLCLSAEHVLPVQPWPEPPADSPASLESPPLQLLQARVRQLQPDFTLQLQELEALCTLCRLLGGLPLGLELAAAQLADQSLPSLLAGLKTGLHRLVSPLQDLAPHHRSLWATFDWSWRLLSSEGQQVLLRLSTFEGDFAVEAALQVGETTLAQLEELHRSSLLQSQPCLPGSSVEGATGLPGPALRPSTRLSLSAPLRQYLREKIRTQKLDESRAIQRYTTYYSGVAAAWLRALPLEPTAADLLPVTPERWNLKHAYQHALKTLDLANLQPLSLGLCTDYRLRGWYREGQQLFTPALARLEVALGQSPPLELLQARAELLAKLGWLALQEGHLEKARAPLEQAVNLASALKAPVLLASHLYAQALMYAAQGEYAAASRAVTEALTRVDPAASAAPAASVALLLTGELLLLQAQVLNETQQHTQALSVLERCRSHCAGAGLWRLEGRATVAQAWALLSQNAVLQARTLTEQALQTARTRDDRAGQLDALVLHQALARRQGRARQAQRWADEALSMTCSNPSATTLVRLHLALFWVYYDDCQLSQAREHLREALSWGMASLSRLLTLQRLAAAAFWKLERQELAEGRVLASGFFQDPLSAHPELVEVRQRLQRHPQARARAGELRRVDSHPQPEMVMGWLRREL